MRQESDGVTSDILICLNVDSLAVWDGSSLSRFQPHSISDASLVKGLTERQIRVIKVVDIVDEPDAEFVSLSDVFKSSFIDVRTLNNTDSSGSLGVTKSPRNQNFELKCDFSARAEKF